jgi:hypothetical protein
MVHVDKIYGYAGTYLVAPAAPDAFADEPGVSVNVRKGTLRACGDAGPASVAEGPGDILENGHGYLSFAHYSIAVPFTLTRFMHPDLCINRPEGIPLGRDGGGRS